jgi:UDP-N-acetylglucosamine--N-acetylmuramyl-(pentapeptide) pyrophosphoryl-undecaprenol N-acetylglucosamine transferase
MKSFTKSVSIAFTGGGTAGHILPGLAVVEVLKNYYAQNPGETEHDKVAIFWICSKSEPEQNLLKNHRIPFKPILSGKLRRYFSLKNLLDIFFIIGGTLQSLRILWREKPEILFSKGGYVSLPPVVAAWILRIPIIIHESDIDPGLTTRITANFAKKILIPFMESSSFYPNSCREKVVVTGNPVRNSMKNGDKEKGLAFCSAPGGQPVIFVAGGSQGAVQINKILENCIQELCERFFVIHQTGSNWTFAFKHNNYRSFEYIGENYADIATAADLVISRAGAGAVWEFSLLGKPMILIPLGSESSRGDQIRNAEFFEKNNAAIVLKGKKVNTENLKNAILSIIENDDLHKKLVNNAALLCRDNAEKLVADIVITHLGGII